MEVAATLENGNVEADKASAAAGETVQLTVTPAPGYDLEAIRVVYTGENGKEQEVTVAKDNTFKMPAGDVVVSARFKAKAELHNVIVTVQDEQGVQQGGKATADRSQAAAGEIVKLDIQADDGWIVTEVTMNGKTLSPTDQVNKSGYQFEMPNEDAKVVVEFFNSNSTAPEA